MEHSQIILNTINKRNISAYKLAKETGISESLFSKWRKNPTSDISSSNLVHIADYLGCSIDYLLGRTDVSTFEMQTNDGNITPREKAVLLAYREKKDMQTAVERLLDVKIEDHPKEAVPTAKEPQEPEYDSFMKRVDTLTDHGRIKLKDAKIAAYGGYENPVATGEDLEKLKQIRRLLQEVIDEQHNQSGE